VALSSPLPACLDIGQGPGRKGAVRPRSCQRGRGAAEGCVVSTLAKVTPRGGKGRQHVCAPHELHPALECCRKPLASSSRQCDEEQGKGSLRMLFQVPPPAVVLPSAQACEWLNKHPLPPVPLGVLFQSTTLVCSALLILLPTPLSLLTGLPHVSGFPETQRHYFSGRIQHLVP